MPSKLRTIPWSSSLLIAIYIAYLDAVVARRFVPYSATDVDNWRVVYTNLFHIKENTFQNMS